MRTTSDSRGAATIRQKPRIHMPILRPGRNFSMSANNPTTIKLSRLNSNALATPTAMPSDSGSDINPDAEDWDELITEDDWEEHDVFRPPTCSNLSCKTKKSELYVAGDLSVCLDCRSITPSATSLLGHITAFPYLTMQQESELRLLLIWPRREDEDEVHGTLVHCHVNDHLEYEAISYTWADEHGDASRSRTIFLNDLPLAVTSSCEAALKRIRLMSAPRVIWMDAVCVNQDDVNERGHQVRLMPEIYSRAKRVLICLGDASENDSTGIYYLATLEPSNYSRDIAQNDQRWGFARNAVQNILDHRYFTRVWILQEIGLARDAVVIYGQYEVPWKLLQQKFIGAEDIYPVPQFNFSLPLVAGLRCKRLPMAFSFTSASIRGPDQMLELLDKARNCLATDPRDKVFALFGLVQLASKFGFVADYTETVAEAYARVAVLLAVRNGLMPILHRAIRWKRQQALPRWVPDWSTPIDPGEPSLVADMSQHPSSRIPVFPTNEGHGMDAIAARICDLGTLIYAGFGVRVTTNDPTEFISTDVHALGSMYRGLNLPPGASLGCYILQTGQSFQDELRRCSDTPITKVTFLDNDNHYHGSVYRPYFVFRDQGAGESLEFIGLCTLLLANNDVRIAIKSSSSETLRQTRKYNLESLSPLSPSRSPEMASHLQRTFLRMVNEHMGKPEADALDTRSSASRPIEDDTQFWVRVWESLDATPQPSQEKKWMPSLQMAEQFHELQECEPSLVACLKILREAVRLKRPRVSVDHGCHGQLGSSLDWLNAWAERELSGLTGILDTIVGSNLARLAQMDPAWDVEWAGESDQRLSVFKPVISLDDFLGDEELVYQRITFGLT